MTFDKVKAIFKKTLSTYKEEHPDFTMKVALRKYLFPSKEGGKKDEKGVVISAVYRELTKIGDNAYADIHARIPFDNDGTYYGVYTGAEPTEPIIDISNDGRQLKYHEFREMNAQFDMFSEFVNIVSGVLALNEVVIMNL